LTTIEIGSITVTAFTIIVAVWKSFNLQGQIDALWKKHDEYIDDKIRLTEVIAKLESAVEMLTEKIEGMPNG